MITICPNCKSQFSIEPEHLGIATVCQSCRKPFVVANAEAERVQDPVQAAEARGGEMHSVQTAGGKFLIHRIVYVTIIFSVLFLAGCVFVIFQFDSLSLTRDVRQIGMLLSVLFGTASVLINILLALILNLLKKIEFVSLKKI